MLLGPGVTGAATTAHNMELVMRPRLLAFALLFGGGLVLSGAAEAAYTTGTVNLRTGPGTQYGIIYSVPPGTHVNVFSCQPSWCQVRVSGGAVGWMSSSFIGGGGGGYYPPPPPPPIYYPPPPPPYWGNPRPPYWGGGPHPPYWGGGPKPPYWGGPKPPWWYKQHGGYPLGPPPGSPPGPPPGPPPPY